MVSARAALLLAGAAALAGLGGAEAVTPSTSRPSTSKAPGSDEGETSRPPSTRPSLAFNFTRPPKPSDGNFTQRPTPEVTRPGGDNKGRGQGGEGGVRNETTSVGDRAKGKELSDETGVGASTCNETKSDLTSAWMSSLVVFARECGNRTLGASNAAAALAALAAPLSQINASRLCRPECVAAIGSNSSSRGLLQAAQDLFDACSGPLSLGKSGWFGTPSFAANATWGAVRSAYAALRTSTVACVPSSLPKEVADRCAPLVKAVGDTLGGLGDAGHCEVLRANLSSAEQARQFCTAGFSATFANHTANVTCSQFYKNALERLADSECAALPSFAALRDSLTGTCVTGKEGQFCAPVLAGLGATLDAIDAQIAAGDAAGAAAGATALCNNTCVRRAAQSKSLFPDGSPGANLAQRVQLVCAAGSRPPNNGGGSGTNGGNKTDSCYALVGLAMQRSGDNDTRRGDEVCDAPGRCFQRLAGLSAKLAADSASANVQSALEARQKYFCAKPPRSNSTHGDNSTRCITKVEAVEGALAATCADAAAGLACSPQCFALLNRTFADLGCCLNVTLQYRYAALPVEEAAAIAGIYGNLTATCGLPVPDACPLNKGPKRSKGIKLCGADPAWLNATGNLEALRQDLLASFGATDDNFGPINVTVGNHSCAPTNGTDSTTPTRRALVESQAALITFDVAGADAQDTDAIFNAAPDADINLSLTLHNLAEGDVVNADSLTLAATQFDPTATGTTTTAPTASPPDTPTTPPTVSGTTKPPTLSSANGKLAASLLAALAVVLAF
jgi:hypothetical protein